ncbi:MAG: hypothetical protein CME06_04825 [Gemmatimonadetes bacterium]|nr:hypothetical protein [Gemmatimonadota bacterium]
MSPFPRHDARHQVPLLFLAALLAATPGYARKSEPGFSLPIIGESRPIEIVPALHEAIVEGNKRVWSELIFVKDATFLKAHLVDVNLRHGDSLTLRTGGGRVLETITGRGPKARGSFWALSAQGEELALELRFSDGYDRSPFRIDQVIVGGADIPGEDPPELESICSPADFEDVICYQGDSAKWETVLASAGVMTVGGNPISALWCSASNVSPKGYVLTNDHCVSSSGDCNSAEFVFKFYRTGCNDGSPATEDWQGYRCDQIVANSPVGSCDQGLNDLDFSLCDVIGNPSDLFGFVAPDPIPLTDGEAIYIVQHPDGRPHEITHGSGANVDVDGTVLRYYDTLDTEGGSSGSPIFRESDNRMVGLHHCGGCTTPGVGNRGMLMSDIYPHIEEFLCSDYLDIGTGGIGGITEINGNGDAVLDPGETWGIRPGVRNLSCDDIASNVRAEVAVNPASAVPIFVDNPTVEFGDVDPSETAFSIDPVVVTAGRSIPCGEIVILDLINIVADNGGPFSDQSEIVSYPVGHQPWATVFFDDFSSGLDAWTIVDGGTGSGPASTWTTANPGQRDLSLTEPFAIADSDELGTEDIMDEQLISPQIDMSAFEFVSLQFSHVFDYYSGGPDEQADVDVRSTATGDWVNVAKFEDADASGTVMLDISQYAAGELDLQVRFHYYNSQYDWYWAVDDVFVLGSEGYICRGPFFTEYGEACAGSSGYAPHLAATGRATPGGRIEFEITGGLPDSDGALFASTLADTSGGCELIQPPLVGPFPLALDASGNGRFGLTVPAEAPVDLRVFVQWTGSDPIPPDSKSNGIEVLVQ